MKSYKFLLLFPVLLVLNDVFAQVNDHAQLSDSLMTVLKASYPESLLARKELVSFIIEKDPVKKEGFYYDYIKKYPEITTGKKTVQDNFRLQLAVAYLQEGKMDDYNRWEKQLKDKSSLSISLYNTAFNWAKKGEHLDDAAILLKRLLELTKEKIANPGTQSFSSAKILKEKYESNYDIYADTYAFILLEQNKPKEALSYEQPVYEKSKGNDVNINKNYTSILKALGEGEKVKQVVEAAIKAGTSSETMNADLKAIYVNEKGSDNGYDQYFAALKDAAAIAARLALAKEMINKPAPVFALKDLDGNTVSLASLKGKVVVIDFWATWCGPCKASFPGMQLAVNKYKDDPNVKFLFIDTREMGNNYLAGVKKFIADNHYSFHVLMDEKGSGNKQSKVMTVYDMPGIPTKYVLDKNGNIRFKKVGFEGTAENLRDEMTMMIEMAANPENVAAKTEKVIITKGK